MKNWLKSAVFYQIYPSSFYDYDGDGYGDFKGITQKLNYIKDLGCNAIWLSACFDTPFADGGYDVRDFFNVSQRFGTKSDLIALLEEAHKLEIKVLLDLVAGHTSEENEMFLKSCDPNENEFTHRYIWTNSAWEDYPEYKLISGRAQRFGNYMVNFFSTQPALNYGFYQVKYPDWQLHYTHPECIKTREYMKSVMRFWLDIGFDGFRVDIAHSLVKGDPDKIGTVEVWQDLKKVMDEYPDKVLVSEWSNPTFSISKSGFDCDFYLDFPGSGIGQNTLFRYSNTDKHSFFDPQGRGDIYDFLNVYLNHFEETKDKGFISLVSGNHDTERLATYYDDNSLKLCYIFLLLMPGVPFLYYGDEIGMTHVDGLNSIECSFNRTGSRTPMQWNNTKNCGFSTAQQLYLPTDSTETKKTVEAMSAEENSIYNTIKELILLRKNNDDFTSDKFEIVYAKKNKFPFVFKRGDYIIAINPSPETQILERYNGDVVFKIGEIQIKKNSIEIKPHSAFVVKSNKEEK